MKAPTGILLLAALFFFTGIAGARSDDVLPSRIKRTPVESSNVSSVGYSRRLHALEIEFVRGAVYRFLTVPPSLYREFVTAGSKGRFIAEKLRGKYASVRVRPRRSAGRSPERLAARER